jgi:hypothetical protein
MMVKMIIKLPSAGQSHEFISAMTGVDLAVVRQVLALDDPQDKACVKTADSGCSFSLQTWGQEITALSFTALRGPDKTAQRDPQLSFERGYYFDGNN